MTMIVLVIVIPSLFGISDTSLLAFVNPTLPDSMIFIIFSVSNIFNLVFYRLNHGNISGKFIHRSYQNIITNTHTLL